MSVVHVIGAAGFAGAQLAHLIDRHPGFELGQITARSDAGARLVDVAPEYRVTARLTELDLDAMSEGQLAAVCYPHATAAPVVARLLERGLRVLDVSADHRLRDPAAYPAHYGFDHPHPELLAEAVYGLPEINRARIAEARLVANPGCYPETSILALLPLRELAEDIVIDAKSGVSGAGKTPTAAVHYSHVTDSIWPYKVFAHRHWPEIEQELGKPVLFTPHLLPADRGLMASCYAKLPDGHFGDGAALRKHYRDFYAGHPFVEVVDDPPTLRPVQHTNYAQVCPLLAPDRTRVAVFAALDNLMKGAAGQALQNLNLMAGFDETVGLL